MEPCLKHAFAYTGVTFLLALLTACGTTATSKSANDLTQNASSRPTACGPAISRDEVQILDVENEKSPLEAAKQRFPNAQFARKDFILTSINETVPRTKNELRNYFARLGCNVVVFAGVEDQRAEYIGPAMIYSEPTGEDKRFTDSRKLRVLWGNDTDR